MTEELQKSLNDRKNIVQAVKQEIVGPSDIKNTEKSLEKVKNLTFTTFEDLNSNYYWKKAGLKEEIIQKEEPSRRYAAGMLYPMEPENSDLNEEELMIDIVNNENITGFYDDKQYDTEEIEENSGLDDLALKIKQKDSLPSSMGLTFCVARNTKNLQIKFNGGLYEKHKIRAEIFNHSEDTIGEKEYNYEQQWWWRTSIFAEEDIELSKFLIGKNSSGEQIPLSVFDNDKKKIENVKLNMHIQCRTNEQYLLLTVTVINVTKPQGNFNLNEHTVFQSNINISAKPGSFLNYPKAFERNLGLTKDEWNNELLYKNKINYAFGHNCSVIWDQNSEIVSEINSTFIPSYETESMTPDVTVKIGEEEINLKVEMQALMNVESYKDLLEILQPLILGYEEWISERRNEVQNLQKELKEAAETNLKLCEENLIRIKRGVEFLKKPKVFRAFKLANQAILLQQINGKTSREAYYEKNNNGLELKIKEKSPESIAKMKDLNSCKNSWRIFQLAFFLLSIPSIVDKDSDDREIVDLIWFPTGGGKTEAYLGVAAFQMFYRRLLDPNDVGVDIIMRYTLRLLTADQFQRASRLICAMEYVRRKYEKELGSDQYSIGIWVGAKTSPNTNKEAFKKYEAMSKSKGPENLVVTRCPWCGCEIGKIEVKGSKNTESKIIGFKKINDNHLIVACPDKECDFHDELPVYFVDETIYKKQPTFLIGTIDKFVQLTWKPEARKLFGLNERGERFVSPPQIIVQDELHLISGPLGTMAGLYEVLIEELCIDDRGQKPVKPKIISATATIKEYEEQVKCLFGRTKASLFPTPGIDIDDSFFSKVAVDNNEKPMPGREYIGVFTSRVGVLMAQVMTYSAILQKTEMLPEERKDPFWTLLSFYNSLRDLGAGLSLFNSDIPTYIDSLIKREGLKNRRFLGAPLELTSRKQSNEISKTIDDLNVPYSVKDNKKRTKALNSCLASNIIEVGVDIDRLSLMGIIGQPKMTAQYIQVSGRVGRRPQERPGLIVTIYSNQNSRDKSHFEHFNEYHQRLYGQVETTSLTPFSTAALERGLTAVIIGFFRQRMDMQIANSPNNKEVRRAINDRRFKAFSNRFKNRVELIDSSQLEVFKIHFKTFMDGILKGRYEVWRVSDTERGLMYQAGNLSDGEKYPGSIPVINSLRSVDAESLGSIILIENDEKDLFQWGEDD